MKYNFESLVKKYSSREMQQILSDENQYLIYRKIWIALAEAEQELGLNITDEQIQEMKDHFYEIDMDLIYKLEKKYLYITPAAIEQFGMVAPKAKPIIHLGATTNDLWDNTNTIYMKDAAQLVLSKMYTSAANLRDFVLKYKDMPILGRTRLQAAQPVTVGKRASVWLQDLILDIQGLQKAIDGFYFRGLKGATGTQASFMELFDDDSATVEELDRRFSEKLGFTERLPITSQIYTRKLESRLMSALAGFGETCQKFGNDMRIMAMLKEMEEPFGKDQVGSSTMAFKRNPVLTEDLAAYSRFIITLLPAVYQATGQELLEQTCDNLAIRILAISNIFLAADVLAETLIRVTDGLVVYEKMIRRNINEELPFLITENVIMEACKKGGDRQVMHHLIRDMSMETIQRVRNEGLDNDLLQKMADSPEIPLSMEEIMELSDPIKFIGRAPEQVEHFVKTMVDPVLSQKKTVPMLSPIRNDPEPD
ncbi:adenylosuccinate lyase [Desulfuromusa kysingii]|uniref:Adenylosuccinate lyase n=1 Tax=Desulfuromusa kysingii TaxID=37625 RepID=A0A1H3X433_9BACT|nr:lyase family protein [Desulfuromusa kysingii]SDZ94175.1 adenylosuccinate lyase [Desulfuromusa kysingii]